MEKTPKDLEFDKAYDIYTHTDTNYHNRVSYFIVAESMFFVAYATLVMKGVGLLSKLLIISTAIGYTLSWWVVSYRTVIRLDFLTQTYLKEDQMYDEYISTAKKQYINTIADFLPCFTFLAWVIFGCITISTYDKMYLYIIWVMTNIMLLLIILLIKCETKK